MSTIEKPFRVILAVLLILLIVASLVVPVWVLHTDAYRNYNEGWNAYFSSYVFGTGDLYPASAKDIFNNYPPLGFAIVAAFTGVTGDPIVAGRILSLLSILGVAAISLLIVYRLCRNFLASLAAASIIIFVISANVPDYLGTNDPQWLAQFLQVVGIAVLICNQEAARLRPIHILLAVGLILAGGLVKHNLVAAPLAVTLWLMIFDRRLLIYWIAYAVVGLLVLAGVAYATFGTIIFSDILSHGRIFSIHAMAVKSLSVGQIFFPYMLLALGGLWLSPCVRSTALLGIYFGASVFEFPLLGGEGTSVNILFDLLITSSMLCGLLIADLEAGNRAPVPRIAGPLAVLIVLSPMAGDVSTFALNHYRIIQAAGRSSTYDAAIRILADHPGPAMCENAEMCFRAGKDFQVDYFNFGQAVATGRRTSAGLDAKISSRYFAAIQLELGPTSLRLPDTTNAAIEANYRVILTDPVYIAIPR